MMDNTETSSVLIPFNIWVKKIWDLLFLISCSVGLVTLVFNMQNELVPNLFCLPIVYCISLLMTRRLFRVQPGLALIILEIVMFLRFVVIPVMYAFSPDYSGVTVPGADFSKAVWLMVYEEIIVSGAMYIWSRIKHNKTNLRYKQSREKKTIRPLTITIAVFWLFIIAVNSKLRGRLFTFSLLSKEELGIASDVLNAKAAYKADIPGIFLVLFNIGIVVLLSAIVNMISNVKLKAPIKAFVLLAVCIGFVSSVWSDGFSVSRWGLLIGTILCLYVLMYAFPKKKKMIVICGIVAVVSVIIGGSVLKVVAIKYTTNGTVTAAFSKYLNAEMFDEYFQGIAPVANGIKTAEIYEEARGLEGVFLDTCYNFPYAMKVLGLSGQHVATDYFHQTTGHYDLIMPTITEGYMQFGSVFAPLYSFSLVLLALWADRRRASTPSFYKKLFYTQLVFWLSLFMAVSTNIIDANIWPSVIAIWIFTIEEKYTFTIGSIGMRHIEEKRREK